MGYSNYNLLCDLIKIKLILPKMYYLSTSNNIIKHIKYFNKLVKNVNRKIFLGLKELSLNSICYNQNTIITKNIPTSINVKQCYYSNEIIYDDILNSYQYISGLDFILYHKLLKRTESILFLIYQNNGKYIKLKSGFNIWNCLPMIDYHLYYKLNIFLKNNLDIDYIRGLLVHEPINESRKMDMETLFLNIMQGIYIYGKLKIFILYYRKENKYYMDNLYEFKQLKKHNDKTNEIIFIDKKYDIGIFRKKIQKCIFTNIDTDSDISYNPNIKIIIKLNNNNLRSITIPDLYLLSYYNLYSDNQNILLYNTNDKRIKFYTQDLNYEHDFILKNKFINNFKLYNTNSEFIKICITNNLYNDVLENHLVKANIDLQSEDLISAIKKIKKYNDTNLYNILYKLTDKSVKEHLSFITKDSNTFLEKYENLFYFIEHIYDKIELSSSR